MFDRKWRTRCAVLEQQVSTLEQQNQALVRELDELRSLQVQSQQEQHRACQSE